MTPQEKIEIIEKIVLPVIFFVGGIIGSVIGYFAGIHKERSNVKWTEKREALKKLDKYLSQLLLIIKKKPFLTKEDIKETSTLLEDSLMLIPSKLRNEFKNFLPTVPSSDEPAKLIYDFRTKIAKELE